MANYKPIVLSVGTGSAVSGTQVYANLEVTSWGLFFLGGIAERVSGTSHIALPSGAVNVWVSTAPTTAAPTYATFADINGRYGISMPSGKSYKIKFYGKGL